MPTKILLADDHALVRDGIKSLLEDEADLTVVAEANNGQEALDIVATARPDLVIMDIRMPRMDGITAAGKLSAQAGAPPCLMLSMHDSEEYVLQSINVGAAGYLLKDASREEFIKAIRTVVGGEKYFSGDLSNILIKQITGGGQPSAPNPASADPVQTASITRRQREILKLIPKGMTNQEIADELGVSRRTVETHRYKMMENLGVNNKSELLKRAVELGLI